MLTGASQADAAVLIVSAKEGIEEQTKRHAFLLKLLGIEQVIVTINKMDLVEYSQEVFETLKERILEYLSTLGINPICVIPISALQGDNIAKKSENTPWYKGKTLLEALDDLEKSQKNYGFRMSIQDVYELGEEKVYVGNIASGAVKKGDKLKAFPSGVALTVKKILTEKEVDAAKKPKAIGIVFEEDVNLSRGEVLAKDGEPRIVNEIEATIFCIDKLENGNYNFCCATQAIPCSVSIIEKLDIETFEKKSGSMQNGDIGKIVIKLEKPAVIESFYKTPELGRFTLEKNNEPVAGGIIV
jgi:sulfate adenylyltransferase subunit 1 (EFTu-like GTPase family)